MAIQKFGRYEVRRPLGQGGMAIVYLAYDPTMKREVAIKVLPSHLTADSHFISRFQQEVETVARLEHPCIVPVYDYGEEENQPYIVMRCMLGGSLLNRLAKGPLDLPELLPIISRVARALDKAHAHGIIHRDLKPGNILFDDQNQAYLSDFGIAKAVTAAATYTGSAIIGTPAYMSPEQGSGSKSLDGRSDIYALGVIVFHALTGQLPYEADTPIAVLMKHITAEIPNLHEIKSDLPPGCEWIIRQAMAKTPEQRYPTAGDLVADLAAVAKGEVVQPRPELQGHITQQVTELSSLKASPEALAIPADVPSPTQKKVEKAGWKLWTVWVGVVGLLLVGGVAAVILAGGNRSTPTPEPTAALAAVVNPTAITPTELPPTDSPTPTGTSTSQVELNSERDELSQNRTILPTATPSPPPTATPSPAPSPSLTPPLLPTAMPLAQEVGLAVDNFEGIVNLSDFVLNRNAGNEGKVSLAGPPHLKQGQQALAFEFDIRNDKPNHYIGFDREFAAQDWSSYTSLCVWVESDGSNRTLVVQFGESKYKFWKSVVSLAMVGVGDTCVSLQGEHQINLSTIGYYGIYVEGPPPGQSVIYLDDVRIVKPPAPTPTATPAPAPTSTPIPLACADNPEGEFRGLWEKYKNRLGCPQQKTPVSGFYAEQPFERGHMFWSKLGNFYLVTIGQEQGSWQFFLEEVSLWKEGMSATSCDAQPPPGLLQPVRGFGGLWCARADIREQIGWGLDVEHGFEDGIDLWQRFDQGIIFRDSDGRARGVAYVLFSDNATFIKEAY